MSRLLSTQQSLRLKAWLGERSFEVNEVYYDHPAGYARLWLGDLELEVEVISRSLRSPYHRDYRIRKIGDSEPLTPESLREAFNALRPND